MNALAARQAAWLLAVDPLGLGGVRLRDRAGPRRDAWLALLNQVWPVGAPRRRLPGHVDEQRLVGGLDLGATLACGRPVAQRGVLAECDHPAGGLLLVPMAERLPLARAAQLGRVIDDRRVEVQREGLNRRDNARLAMVALDEGVDAQAAPAALSERLGLWLDLSTCGEPMPSPDAATADRAARARARLPDVTIDDAMLTALVEAADALGVRSMRAVNHAVHAARAAAAWAGHACVERDDAAWAARLVLAPRATRLPAQALPAQDDAQETAHDGAGDTSTTPEDSMSEPVETAAQDAHADAPPDPPTSTHGDPAAPHADQGAHEASMPDEALADAVLNAALAALPPGLLAQLAVQHTRVAGAAGRSGASQASRQRGRPCGSHAGDPRHGSRLHLVDTLRAAAPWQRLRRAERERARKPHDAPATGSGNDRTPMKTAGVETRRARVNAQARHEAATTEPRGKEVNADARRDGQPLAKHTNARVGHGTGPFVQVRREDLRVQRRRERRETTTLFIVDASGSAALHRLAEAKGAVELLLAECYVRRDRVALLAFRGMPPAPLAELLLPPTRSLARARRCLAALPGGGGTPLASALDAALAVVRDEQRRGATPLTVVLSDGRANVARDGSPGRTRAAADALASARAFADTAPGALWLDIAPQPQEAARRLADAMGARYLPLPHADARQMCCVVKAAG
jgi:magnesium chelatase subunit D